MWYTLACCAGGGSAGVLGPNLVTWRFACALGGAGDVVVLAVYLHVIVRMRMLLVVALLVFVASTLCVLPLSISALWHCAAVGAWLVAVLRPLGTATVSDWHD